MSTNYYAFQCGISSVRVTEGPGHDRVEVWQRGGKCGDLVVDLGTGKNVANLFRSEEPVLHTYYGGKGIGMQVQWNGLHVPSTVGTYIWSEESELCSVNDLLAQIGAGA